MNDIVQSDNILGNSRMKLHRYFKSAYHEHCYNENVEVGEAECLVGHFMRPKLLQRMRCNTLGAEIHFSYDHLQNREYEVRLDDDNSVPELSIMSKNELHEINGTSWQAAILIMANCTIGMGLLNFPSAILKSGGILPAMLVQMIILVLIVLSLCMLRYLCYVSGEVTYQGVVSSFLGTKFAILARILLFANNFGSLILFLIVIGDQIEIILITVFEHPVNHLLNKKILVPLIATIFIFPLCLLKRFDAFKYTSFIGVIAALYVTFGVIMVRYFFPYGKTVTPSSSKSVPHIMKIVPLICFAFECHVEMPPMCASLRKSTFGYGFKLIIGYVTLSGIVYSFSGIFGYLKFLNDTPEDILVAFHSHDPLVIIAYFVLSLKIITTYPVVFYCLRTVVDEIARKCVTNRSNTILYRFVISSPIFIISILLAIFVPSISLVVNFVGGISGMFIFVFPGLCLYQINLSDRSAKAYVYISLGILYCAIGVFILVVTTGFAIQDYSQ